MSWAEYWKKTVYLPLGRDGFKPAHLHGNEHIAMPLDSVHDGVISLSDDDIERFIVSVTEHVCDPDFVGSIIQVLEQGIGDRCDNPNISELGKYLRSALSYEDRKELKRLI